MAFNFKKFTAIDTSFDAKVTIRKTGQIGFNSGAINSFKIRDYDYAVLYFDAEYRAVGIGLMQKCEDGAIPLKKGTANTYLRAKNFCDCYHIDYSESRRYSLKRDEDSGLFYFCLDEGEDVNGDTTEQETEEE